MENITMGREAATFENVQWAAENLGLNEFIQSLPKGYDTMMDPEGRKLPSSKIQKLLLARSIADKPKLLLFEDTFEPLDKSDKKRVIDFITSKENGWTILAVSSDHYLASKCDKVAVMKSGKIDSIGTYDEMKNIANLNVDSNA
jgi:ABC-type bacteriocin/lantibiotic exporter with double-glycine peptidase domain